MSVGTDHRSYLRLDLSSIPAGATVSAADLRICRISGPGSARTHELRPVTSVWTETGLTWNTQPSLAATAQHTVAVPSSAGCTTTSVKEDVQAWLLSAANFGWRIADQDETTAPLVDYATRESLVSSERPTLSVTYNP